MLTTPLKAGTQNETLTSMTQNTRKQNNILSTQLKSYIQEMNVIDIAMLSLKQLNLLDAISFLRKPTKAGRKLTSEKEYGNFGIQAAHIRQ